MLPSWPSSAVAVKEVFPHLIAAFTSVPALIRPFDEFQLAVV